MNVIVIKVLVSKNNRTKTDQFQGLLTVVYFEQHLGTPNACQNLLFQHFLCKKLKKEEKGRKLRQN